MKKLIFVLLSVPLFVFAATPAERLTSALSILKELSNIPDSGAFVDLLRQSEGIAIYPSLIKVGLVIGGQYGEGLVFKRDVNSGKWFGPLFVKLSGLSLGAQIGVQNVGLVLVLMNEDAVKSFTSSNVTLGGNISVAAGPMGRSLSADTDYKLQASIYSYSVSKGFFAGLSLQGSVVQVDEDANKQFYGSVVSASDLLKAEPKTKEAIDLINYLNNLIYLQPNI
ncbi:MAG TPA: lipid-binding SYLF domain-containing protein [Pseudothermotoga sp.]|nr:lipid-binding SYLF domain-containing protein [Pseudothermotoga sp.]HOK84357.1 lipid-binding SYLF domain-containing protein [Pseudothermotoga sp.]